MLSKYFWTVYNKALTTTFTALLAVGTQFSAMAWRSSGESNRHLVDNLKGNVVVTEIFRNISRFGPMHSPLSHNH